MFLRLYKLKFLSILTLVLLATVPDTFAQLTIVPTATAAALTAKLTGPGITIISDTLICNTTANGIFRSVSTPIALDSGIILCTGLASQATGAESPLTSTGFGSAGDADLTSFLGSTTISRDGCALIIHFVPKGDTVSFRYQFGSEEYRTSTCGPYNDAFAFFIAGPGVSSTLPGVNMALVPGTSVPVAVNTVNSGVVGTGSGCALSNCTSYGSGSPFTAYYINNAGGSQVAYRGYTTVFTAKHWVIPCDTYRIKMSIVDAGNTLYDSGVFIEAGSLKANTYHFDRAIFATANVDGFPNSIVKGCAPDTLLIKSVYPVSYPTTLHLAYSGTGVPGFDYSALPDSIILPAGDTSVSMIVNALATAPAGVKTLNIFITSASTCGAVDTISINLIDHPSAVITTHDTTICTGTPVLINVNGTSGLAYSWASATFLDNATLQNPTSTPTTNIIYTMTATLPGSRCPAMVQSLRIDVITPVFNILTPDTTICQGAQFTIRVNGSDSMNYTWYPGTGLTSAVVKEPIAFPNVTTTYSVTGTYPGIGCSASHAVTVTVVPLDFTVSTIDTYLCEGATINLNVSVSPAGAYTYQWSGPNGYSSFATNPVISTASLLFEGTYVVTVTNAGLCSVSKPEHITVFPTPSTPIIAPPVELCQNSPGMPLHIKNYNNIVWYSSAADTTATVFAPVPNTDSIGTQHFYGAMISLLSNCIGSKQELTVNVVSCCTGTLHVPEAFTPNNDGKNDILHVVKSADYVVDQFTIYNRWGQEVFHSSSEKPGWDGTVNGQPADMATYFYVLVANCLNGSEGLITKKGSVVLIR